MREQGSLKNIINLVKKDRRYWVVAILLISVAAFGQKVPNGEATNNRCLAPIWDPSSDSYTMSASQGTFTVKNFFNSQTGDYYRVNFRVKAINLASSAVINSDATLAKANLEIWVKNNIGEEMLLGSQAITKDGVFYQDEIVFQTNESYSDLEFRRTDKVLQDTIEIDKKISLSRLNIVSNSEANQLLQTLGNKISLSVTPVTDMGNDKIIYNFSTGKTFGQIFQAETDIMSQVELKLHFLGNGGHGRYRLALYEVNDNKINSEILASVEFDAATADSKFQSNPSAELYRFPLVSKLERGKNYYLAIDSLNVTTNLINRLQVYGSSGDQYALGNAASSNRNKLNNRPVDVYFKIISPVTDKVDLTIGAIVEDLGHGVGAFSFRSRGEAFDALAMFQKAGSTKFDSDEKALLVEAENNNYLIYKFNTIYHANKAHIRADIVGGDFVPANLEYSINGNDWIQIDSAKDKNLPDTYEASFNTNKSTALYLRVTYNKDEAIYKSQKYFGLKNLEVGASLDY